MRDRKLEADIIALKGFIQLWVAFGDLLKQGGENLTSVNPVKEQEFMESKSLLARKYESIGNILERQYSPDNKISSILSQSVSLSNIAASDMQSRKLGNDWHVSYIFLNKRLGGLEGQKEALSKISKIGTVIIPKIRKGLIKLFIFAILIAVLTAGAYVGYRVFFVKTVAEPKAKTNVPAQAAGSVVEDKSIIANIRNMLDQISSRIKKEEQSKIK
ncbi:hypothetical protein KKC91_08955 [bacterium]|nr:hypothetical protein [bacterium]